MNGGTSARTPAQANPATRNHMNDTGEQTPTKTKRPRRRQQVTVAVVGAVIKGKTPAPLDDVLQAIRGLADSGFIDPEDGLVREEFSKPRALRGRKSAARL